MTGPAESVESVVFESLRFRNILQRAALDAIVFDLNSVEPSYDLEAVNWNFAVLCCSALTSADSEAAQEAVLRVSQACLHNAAEPSLRDAAVLLLERLGNRRTVALASSRGLVDGEVWSELPAPLQMDVIRRRLELAIPANGHGPIAANTFQRRFWTEASQARWLSVSAPTSAGKSYIVKRWLERSAASKPNYTGVYLVPTRALIEEVSNDLREEFGNEVAVFTIPWDSSIGQATKEMYVLTQERYHLLQQKFPDFSPEAVFVDEAQKFGDDQRGVLLQQVIDETVFRDANTQVIFASPLSENPETLLRGAPDGATTASIVSQTVTVSQNLLWVNQVPRRPTRWSMEWIDGGTPTEVGQFDLSARPAPDSKRLPLVAVALGGYRSGNIVYVNGAADAEKASRQIFDGLGAGADLAEDEDIANLAELARSAVHPQYALAEVVLRGVAFHYGNMPQLLRVEIERLFRLEKLRYLVCTSTLLEGVNLPCRNLFARGPKKGNGRAMTGADFWNLAGRAGRWGSEFQGNIICIDTSDSSRWPAPPMRRTRQPLIRASDNALSDIQTFLLFVQSGAPLTTSGLNPTFEPVFSLLATRVAQGRSLSSISGLSIDQGQLADLTAAITQSIRNLDVPASLMAKHAGISPLAMQRLLDYFAAYDGEKSMLLVAPPESSDAAETYVRALSRIARHFGNDFGPAGRQFALAILVVQWMRGLPLARLIGDRIDRARQASAGATNVPSLIRQVMKDVEQVARFEAPKYLACYLDLLRFYFEQAGIAFDDEDFPDVSMMLELGVSRATEVALMSLGLSRTTTVAVSEYITDDDLDAEGALAWLVSNNLDSFALPELVKREVRTVLAARRPAEDESAG